MNRASQDHRAIHSKAISHLVRLVKNSGDNLLNGNTKLALTPSILAYINSMLTEVLEDGFERSFVVQQTNYCKQSIIEDLQFLYDFIQKSAGVKITHGQQTLQGNVDISHFRSLKVLELRKIPIHLVVGLHSLGDKLQTIICSRCLHRLKDLFEHCGGDMGNQTIWKSLTVAVLSYNTIDELDDSVNLLPNLEVLDVSHNYIRKLNYTENFPKLKLLNISYNYLDEFTLSPNDSENLSFLRCLILRNNNLETLNGVSHLRLLEQLDAGYNCISEHSALHSLKSLSSLKLLWLDGNPISCHSQHRKLTIEKLHPSAINRQFNLDGTILTKTEKLYMKQFPRYSDGCYAPVLVHASLNSDLIESTSSFNSSQGSSIKRKKGIVREVDISENNQVDVYKDDDSSLSSVSNPNHLKKREEMENFRKKFGPAWLVETTRENPCNQPEKSTSSVEEITTSQEITPDKTESLIARDISMESELDSSSFEKTVKASPNLRSTDENYENNNIERDSNENILPVASNESTTQHKLSDNDLGYASDLIDNSIICNNSDALNNSTASLFSNEDVEFDNSFFIAKRINDDKSNTPLLLIIKENFLYEKDIQGRTLTKLDLRGLFSYEKLLHLKLGIKLIFDSVCKDKKQRVYQLEEEHNFENFLGLLQPIMELTILENMRKGSYKCLKCEAEFFKGGVKYSVQSSCNKINTSSNQNDLEEIPICPNCDSDMLLELDEVPVPNNALLDVKKPSSISSKNTTNMTCRNQLENISSDNDFGELISNQLAKTTKRNEITSSKSLPATPVQHRRLMLDSYQAVKQQQQQQRGKLEQMARNELFSLNVKPEDKRFYSKSCGHSPSPSSSKIDLPKNNTDDDISLIESEMRQDNSNLDDTFLKENLSSLSGGIRIFYGDPPVISNVDSNTPNILTEDVINCNVPRGALTINKNHVMSFGAEMEDANILISASGSTMRRSESDITILSNPSQSSISVLSTPSGDILPLDSIAESTSEAHKQISSYSELMKSHLFPRSSSPISGQISSDDEQGTYTSQRNRSLNEAHESISSGSICSSISTNFEQTCEVNPALSPISQHSQNSRLHGTSSQSTIQSLDPVSSSESIYYSSDNTSPKCHREQASQLYLTCLNNNPVESDSSTFSEDDHSMEKYESMNESKERPSSRLSAKSFKYSFEDFSRIDHRIHLFLDMKVFETGEMFDSLLKTNFFTLGKVNGEFSGFLIMSTRNIYIYKINGNEETEMKKWMEKIDVHPLASLLSINLLLANQAFTLEFKGSNHNTVYMILLRDGSRCNNYFGYLTERMKQGVFSDSLTTVSLTPDLLKYLQRTLDFALSEEETNSSDKEITLYLMCHHMNSSSGTPVLEPVSLAITATHVVMIKENFDWYHPKSKILPDYKIGPFKPLQKETIKDLLRLAKHREKSNELRLYFFNEDSGNEVAWHIISETETSIKQIISVIKDPWEKLFDVDLQMIEDSNV